MWFPAYITTGSDVPAEGYIPRASYSPCRDGCAGCGKPVPVDDPAKAKAIGAGVYHYPKCYRAERRAIAETERVLERAGLGTRRRT